MASPLERASTQRKLSYFALIAAIFTASMVWRGTIGSGPVYAYSLRAQADRLELNERNQGEADLTGSAIRLGLYGSRGLAVCGLWWAAIEKQKRHEWNELEVLVSSITKLQPHFITPWLYQSWNISYNVSVESDRLKDMYFYISRGIELLAQGERLNRKSPDLRYWIAFYYQNKFGVSDKVKTLRSLFQLSCIPPDERDPKRFWLDEKAQTVNLEEFKKFCIAHPQLVMRLREPVLRFEFSLDPQQRKRQLEQDFVCTSPAEVVLFLKDNADVPSRYKPNSTELEDPKNQFPVLPPPEYQHPQEKRPTDSLDDRYDAFEAARSWFRYSLEILPPPPSDEPIDRPKEYDREKYRLPKQPALIIFRQGAPRAQTYLAERLTKEGWIDGRARNIDDGQPPIKRYFPNDDVELVAGTSSKIEWQSAATMWQDHGVQNSLLLSTNTLNKYQRNKADFLRKFGISPTSFSQPQLRPEEARDPANKPGIEAMEKLQIHAANLQMTNYEFFRLSSIFEAEDETIQARQALFEALRAQQRGDVTAAQALFEKALGRFNTATDKWEPGLLAVQLGKPKHAPLLRHSGNRYQEDTYEIQEVYMYDLLIRNSGKARADAFFAACDVCKAQLSAGLNGVLGLTLINQRNQEQFYRQFVRNYFIGPFDGDAPDGFPWINPVSKNTVRARRGDLQKQSQPAPTAIRPETATAPGS